MCDIVFYGLDRDAEFFGNFFVGNIPASAHLECLPVVVRQLPDEKVQASQYKSWTEGRVEYDKITLNELAIRLSRKYDVRIHLDDNLEKEVAFRVSLRNEETVGDVFQALSEIIPIRYERRGRDIYIKKQ